MPGKNGLGPQERRAQGDVWPGWHCSSSLSLRNLAVRTALCLLFLSVFFAAARAQISPGPLSRPHQSLNGSTNCASCHKFGGQAALKCLDCHAEIATRLSARKGLHATYNIPTGSSQECARCHSEHNGEDFPLIKWDIKIFNHKDTGYLLEGKHEGLAVISATIHRASRNRNVRPSRSRIPAGLTWVSRLAASVATKTSTRVASDRTVAVPQLRGLEELSMSASRPSIRSLEDAISADRHAYPGAVRQVPYERSGRQAAIRGHSVHPVLRLPQRSAPRKFPARLRVVPQH